MSILSKIAKVVGLFFLMTSGEARNLPNPYGKNHFEISEIEPVTSLDQCDWESGRTVTLKSTGQTYKDLLCYRGMEEPDPANFREAVMDGAAAMLVSNNHDLSDVMKTWPVEARSKLHDEAMKVAKKFGSKVESNMPTYHPSGVFESEFTLFQKTPHHMSVFSRSEQPVNVEIEPKFGR
jgi:hypothetical protein